MNVYSLQITTVAGFADSDFLERLADRAYPIGELVNLHMGLNDDGSIEASFEITAPGAIEAAGRGVELFSSAVDQAEPPPHGFTSTVASFAVSQAVQCDLATA